MFPWWRAGSGGGGGGGDAHRSQNVKGEPERYHANVYAVLSPKH